MKVLYLYAKVKVRPSYECHKCQRSALGSTLTIEAESLERVFNEIAHTVAPARAMPIGWASGLEGFTCPNHKT